MIELKTKIIELYDSAKSDFSSDDINCFEEFKKILNTGKVRAAEFINEKWVTNEWVKKGILLGFRMGIIVEFSYTDKKVFYDKHTYPEKTFSIDDNLRLVPGGSSVRDGVFIASSVTMMPPMYINVGAYIDEGSMIDSHALVGSCAQVGKNVHLSAGAILGGVLEPIGANPVIIENNVFVGGNAGIFEGVIVKQKAIIAAGVIITAGTPVYDAVNKCFLKKDKRNPVEIPERAVVVSGSRKLESNPNFSVYCPIIIKYRDNSSDNSVSLEMDLRIFDK